LAPQNLKEKDKTKKTKGEQGTQKEREREKEKVRKGKFQTRDEREKQDGELCKHDL
jgi:hypothetical protein